VISSRAHALSTLVRLMLISALLVTMITFAMVNASAREVARGEGSAPLEGLFIKNSHFQLSKTDPSIVVGVQFMIANAQCMHDVRIRLDRNGDWYPCDLRSEANGWLASCDVAAGAQIRVGDMEALRVVTVQ
jgi:hypothetical protein